MLRQIRSKLDGLYFPPGVPIFLNVDEDYRVITYLIGCSGGNGFGTSFQQITRILMLCNKHRKQMPSSGSGGFWQAVSKGVTKHGSKIPQYACQLIAVAMLKARQRYLLRYPSRSMLDIDLLLTAYTQHFLIYLVSAEKSRHNVGFHWRLSTGEKFEAVDYSTPVGPSKQVSKNRFKLSPDAAQILKPIAELAGEGKIKPDLMGMAASIFESKPQKKVNRKRKYEELEMCCTAEHSLTTANDSLFVAESHDEDKLKPLSLQTQTNDSHHSAETLPASPTRRLRRCRPAVSPLRPRKGYSPGKAV